MSEQPFEFVDRQTCVSNDSTHREGVDRVVPRDCEEFSALCHHNVPALSRNLPSGLLQRLYCSFVIDPGKPRQLGP